MINLTAEQIKLAEQLLITVLKREPYVEYKELGDRINPPVYHRNVPRNIGVISELCFQLDLPFLSAKVVNKDSHIAGDGFYKLYIQYYPEAKSLTPKEVYKNECKKIRECNEWYKLADYLNIGIDLPRPTITIEKDVKKAIKILPMSSKEEFPGMSIEDVQNAYFLGELINDQSGMYYFKKTGMNAIEGSLVLFQFDNMIIASAQLLSIEKFDIPVEG